MSTRCDGQPIQWPQPTHGPGRVRPYRTAAECIDWSIPCPSIFDRKKPLAAATLRRIARGIMRYVIDAKQPFVVQLTHQGSDNSRVYSVEEPLRTVTGANRGDQSVVTPLLARLGQAGGNGSYVNDVRDPVTTVTTKAEHLLVTPLLSPVKTWGGGGNDATPADRPLRTVTTSKRGEHALVIPTLVQTGYGLRDRHQRLAAVDELARLAPHPVARQAQELARLLQVEAAERRVGAQAARLVQVFGGDVPRAQLRHVAQHEALMPLEIGARCPRKAQAHHTVAWVLGVADVLAAGKLVQLQRRPAQLANGDERRPVWVRRRRQRVDPRL